MLDTNDFEELRALRFQALADPTRLRIIATLGRDPLCVCKIQAALGPIAPNLLSYHLGILRGAGLVSARRRGRWLDYTLEYGALRDLRASLPDAAGDAGTPTPPTVGEEPRSRDCCG